MPSANADHLPIVESRYPPLRLAEKYFKSRIPANLPPKITPSKAIKLQKRCRAAIEHGSGGGMFEAREILKRHDLPMEALGYPLLQGVGVLDLSRPGLDLTSEGLNADSWIKEQDEVWRAGWEQDVDPLGGCQPDKFRWIDVRKRTCEGLDEELRRFEEPKGWISRWNTTERDESSVSGETDSGSWTLKRAIIVAPGCLLLPQYYTPNEQLSLLQACMREYPKPPNPTNMRPDLHLHLRRRNQHQRSDEGEEEHKSEDEDEAEDEVKGPWEQCLRRRRRQAPAANRGLAREEVDSPPPDTDNRDRGRESLVRNMRWTNLGWVYDWTKKAYEFDLEPSLDTKDQQQQQSDDERVGSGVSSSSSSTTAGRFQQARNQESDTLLSLPSQTHTSPSRPSPPIPFPPTLAREMRAIVAGIPWRDVFPFLTATSAAAAAAAASNDALTWPTSYDPSSGIVNYYPLVLGPSSSMTSHVDRAESENSRGRPLVSVSLGAAAIFLLGGTSRGGDDDAKADSGTFDKKASIHKTQGGASDGRDEVIKILLRSGDVLIMSGEEGRARYHGVPRVLEGTAPRHLRPPPPPPPQPPSAMGSRSTENSGNDTATTNGHHDLDQEDAAFSNECLRYISEARINVNARQVF